MCITCGAAFSVVAVVFIWFSFLMYLANISVGQWTLLSLDDVLKLSGRPTSSGNQLQWGRACHPVRSWANLSWAWTLFFLLSELRQWKTAWGGSLGLLSQLVFDSVVWNIRAWNLRMLVSHQIIATNDYVASTGMRNCPSQSSAAPLLWDLKNCFWLTHNNCPWGTVRYFDTCIQCVMSKSGKLVYLSSQTFIFFWCWEHLKSFLLAILKSTINTVNHSHPPML
jgi:hypothetical protein